MVLVGVGNRFMFCSNCGSQNIDHAKFCYSCGQSLASHRTRIEANENSSHNSIPKREKYKLLVGKNHTYYFYKWQINNGVSEKWGFNWAALFLGIIWLGYRKMYLWMLLIFISEFLAGVLYYSFNNPILEAITYLYGPVIHIILGCYGNKIYYNHVKKNITDMEFKYVKVEDFVNATGYKGGTSIPGLIAGMLLTIIFAFVISFIHYRLLFTSIYFPQNQAHYNYSNSYDQDYYQSSEEVNVHDTWEKENDIDAYSDLETINLDRILSENFFNDAARGKLSGIEFGIGTPTQTIIDLWGPPDSRYEAEGGYILNYDECGCGFGVGYDYETYPTEVNSIDLPLYEYKTIIINQLGLPTEEYISEMDSTYKVTYDVNGYLLVFSSNTQDMEIIGNLHFYHPFD